MIGLLGSLVVVRQKQKKNPSVYFESPANYKTLQNAQEIRNVHG